LLGDIEREGHLTMEYFAEGCKHKNAYTMFYTRFVPAIVGPDLFCQHIQDNKEDEPYTASDGAFTVLLLENSYDHWLDIYDKNVSIPTQ
jgi:hypothetical protein